MKIKMARNWFGRIRVVFFGNLVGACEGGPPILFLFCFVFAAFTPKCKVIRKRDTNSHARHIPKARPQHRELRALLLTNSVWVL